MGKEPDFFSLKYNEIPPMRGRLLVSEPFTEDMMFKRSVVLLTDYSETGSVGFILNKPLKKKISEISDEFGNFDASVSMGGPVGRDRIYYLHTLGEKIPGSIHIFDNIFWGGDYEKLYQLISSKQIAKEQIRFFVGYSGWDAGQLDNEIAKNFWLVSTPNPATIMKHDKRIWNDVVKKLDEKYRVWENFPENPVFN